MEDIVRTLNDFATSAVNYNMEIGLLKIVKGKHKSVCDLYNIVQDAIGSPVTSAHIGKAIIECILIFDSFVDFEKYVHHATNLFENVSQGLGEDDLVVHSSIICHERHFIRI